MISINFSSTVIEDKPSMKCIVRVTHSMFKTKYGYSKRTDIRDLKVKSDLSMSDISVDDSEFDLFGWSQHTMVRGYRAKPIVALTERELFIKEAKHYESVEDMFDSGKFKLVDKS